MFVCPTSVAFETEALSPSLSSDESNDSVFSEELPSRGSWSNTWRADEPQASRPREASAVMAVKEKPEVFEETCVPVSKSHVLIVWSKPTLYATDAPCTAEFGWNTVPVTA